MYFSTRRVTLPGLRNIAKARPQALLLVLPFIAALSLPQSAQAAPAASGTEAVSGAPSKSANNKPRPSPQAILDGVEALPPPPAAASGPVIAAATPSNTPRPGSDDPVLKLLSDKGLLPTPVSTFAGQVKDKASDIAADMVISAMEFLGVPYRLGGNSAEEGFDCSGFTRHVFESSLGLILPRRAAEQAQAPELVNVDRNELKPGDLVFFNTLRRTFSHVGIYIGDNKFIHAPRSGAHVRIEDMRLSYWQKRFDGARRAPTPAAQRKEH